MSSIRERGQRVYRKKHENAGFEYIREINGYKFYNETNKFKPNRQEYFPKIPY